MPTNFDQSFYGGVWYNKKGQVIFGVVEADSTETAMNKFTGHGFRTGLKSGPTEIRMLGISSSPILQARVRNRRLIATTYNRWLRRTNTTGTVIQSQPWTKPIPPTTIPDRSHDTEYWYMVQRLSGSEKTIEAQRKRVDRLEEEKGNLEGLVEMYMDQLRDARRGINTLEAEKRALKRANEMLDIPGPLVPEYKLKAANDQIDRLKRSIENLRKDKVRLLEGRALLRKIIRETSELLKEL